MSIFQGSVLETSSPVFNGMTTVDEGSGETKASAMAQHKDLRRRRASSVNWVRRKRDRAVQADSMSSLLMKHEKIMLRLMKFTGWSRSWVENLWAYCMSMKPLDSDTIPHNEFVKEMSCMFGMTSSLFVDRAFDVFRRFSPDSKFYPETMFKGSSIMLSNDLNIKIDYVFDIYDFNFDGVISFDELLTSLKDSIVEEDYEAREEGLMEIFDMVKKFLDVNVDGFITREEFRYRVQNNVLLLEILGPCLPSASHRRHFFDLISPEKTSTASLQQKLEKRQIAAASKLGVIKEKPAKHYPFLIVMPTKEDLKRFGRKIES